MRPPLWGLVCNRCCGAGVLISCGAGKIADVRGQAEGGPERGRIRANRRTGQQVEAGGHGALSCPRYCAVRYRRQRGVDGFLAAAASPAGCALATTARAFLAAAASRRVAPCRLRDYHARARQALVLYTAISLPVVLAFIDEQEVVACCEASSAHSRYDSTC